MKLFFLILFFPLFSYSQTSYPKDYFVSPLDIPLQLSGNFGELRPNHFHSGFDFKTLQREGLNVKAAAEGYVLELKFLSLVMERQFILHIQMVLPLYMVICNLVMEKLKKKSKNCNTNHNLMKLMSCWNPMNS